MTPTSRAKDGKDCRRFHVGIVDPSASVTEGKSAMGGIWALFTRSLRLEARDRWAHGLRGVALALGYIALWNAHKQSVWFGAPGLRFFEMVVMMNAWLIVLAGIGYFSSTITEEKEENTLGLMLMTGLSPLGLLLGKAGGRLVQAVILILLQIPLALLAITLGGITLSQVYAAVMALIALLFCVGNVALLCSVLCRTTRAASMAVIVVTAVYCFLAWACEMIYWQYTRVSITQPFWSGICSSFCFRRLFGIFESSGQPPFLSSCEMVFFTLGGISFFLSWALFGWAVRQPDTIPATRSWWLARNQRFRLVSPGRVWPAAMAWKELFFTLGGWQQLLFKAMGYGFLLVFIIICGMATEGRDFRWQYSQEIAVFCYSLAMAFEGTLLASRVFSEEIRHQTWATLSLTPLPIIDIICVKWAAVFVGLLPVAFFDFLVIVSSDDGLRNFANILDDAMFWGIVAMFITCAHFAAVYSLYVRWGAVPLGVATVWMSFALMMILGEPGMREDVAGALACMASLVACVVCHIWLYNRLEQLAAQ